MRKSVTPSGFERFEKLRRQPVAVPPAAGNLAFAQLRCERQDLDRVQPHQPDITERRRKPPRKQKFLARARRHRCRSIEQHPHRHARLDLEHLEKHLVEPHVGAPVDGAKIVALMEMAVIEKLLAAAGEARAIVPADKTGERTLPVDGQAFEAFQKFPVQQGLRSASWQRRPL